jgi:hypothetical protein
MKKLNRHRVALIASCCVITVLLVIKVLADPPQPGVSIQSFGTNVFSISVTNGVSTANYDLYWTPILANPDYPWAPAAIGTTGQTNFLLDMTPFTSGFFRVLLETTNSIPPWKAADPNNPGAGVLAVSIDSPTNAAVISH